MTNEVGPEVPTSGSARRYEHQIHTLVDEQSRAYVLGLAVQAVEDGQAIRPLEGAVMRDIVDAHILAAFRRDPMGFTKIVERGRREVARRQAKAAKLAKKRTADRAVKRDAVPAKA